MNIITTKSYVQPDGSALFVCPDCGFQKSIPTSCYRHKAHQLKIRCKCGITSNLFLEFRRFFRKAVNLHGECSIITGNGENKHVILTDLSMGGTCMELDRAEEFAPKSQGIMKFTLDDRHKTKVVKKFTVKSVSGNRIHCEFFKDKEYERELGFYLRK